MPLHGATKEVEEIRHHFPGQAMLNLDHQDATVDMVLRQMESKEYPYIHLACHGLQDSDDPQKSAFVLYDGKLDLAQLMSKTADNAQLAFLSACQTATGDVNIPEESVHLAAGMLAVGYRGVIGTMWSIHDEDAPLVADQFYRHFLGTTSDASDQDESDSKASVGKAAHALHEAVKVLRGKVGESNFARWVPFVHFGM